MQQTVPVVSTSPPNVMAATKSVAKDATAPEQDQFDLVLQKTSENLKQKGSSPVRDREEPRTIENKIAQSSDRENVPREAEKTSEVKSKTSEKQLKNKEKDVVSVEQEQLAIFTTTAVVQDTIQMVNQSNSLIDPVVVVEESQAGSVAMDPDAVGNLAQIVTGVSSETAANDILVPNAESIKAEPATDESLTSISKTIDQELTSVDPTIGKQHKPITEMSESDRPTSQQLSLTSLKDLDPEKIGKLAQDGSKGSRNEIEPEFGGGAKVSVEGKTNTNSQPLEYTISNLGGQVKSEVTIADDPKITARQKLDTAPPDIPKVTENPIAVSNVTSQQVTEPARLAEAPKNEVVINQVANQINQMVHSNRSSLRVQLYPEELGHIDLKIVTTKNGVDVTLIADRASTHEVLKSEMTTLKQSIQQAGVQLSDVNIGQGQNSNRQQLFEDKRNFSASAYQADSSVEIESTDHKRKPQLQSSAVDYRI